MPVTLVEVPGLRASSAVLVTHVEDGGLYRILCSTHRSRRADGTWAERRIAYEDLFTQETFDRSYTEFNNRFRAVALPSGEAHDG